MSKLRSAVESAAALRRRSREPIPRSWPRGENGDHQLLDASYRRPILPSPRYMDRYHSDGIRAQVDAKGVRAQAYNEGCKWATGRVVVPPKLGSKPAQTVRANATR